MKKLLLIAFLAFSFAGLSAQTFTDNGIKYNITDTAAKTVEVIANLPVYTGNITIPSTVVYSSKTYHVTALADNAFKYCINLTSVSIPASITRIGTEAFAECYGLASIAIPAGVTDIAEGAFSNCKAVTQFTVDATNSSYSSVGGVLFDKNQTKLLAYPMANMADTYTVPSTVTSIGKNVFYNNSKLTSIILPSDLTTIGDMVFYGASNLATLNIPATVNYIGTWAFNNTLWYTNYMNSKPDGMIFINISLYSYKGIMPDSTNIVIPDGTVQICNGVFKNVSGLKSVSMPVSLKIIEESAFQGCENLTNIVIPNSVTIIGKSAFYGCTKLQSVTLSDNLTKIEDGLFSNCSALTSISIPASVTSIGDGAFEASGLTSVTVPGTVENMGKWVFNGCSKLTSAVFAGHINSIGESVFTLCTKLASVTLPGDLTSLEMGAFDNCSALKSILIPNTVDTIGDYVFNNCSALATIQSYPAVPPKLGNMVFGNVNKNTCKLQVQQGSLSAYDAAEQWTDFINTDGSLKPSHLYVTITALPNSTISIDVDEEKGKEYWVEAPENTFTKYTSNGFTKFIDDVPTGTTGVVRVYATSMLGCRSNAAKVTAIDVSTNPALIGIWCYGNEITHLNTTGCTELEYLVCYNNKLTTIDVSTNTKLDGLECDGNQLISINVTNFTKLLRLYCNNNNMDACSLDKLYKSLPNKDGFLNNDGNPGTLTSTTSIAENKGWFVLTQGDGTGCAATAIAITEQKTIQIFPNPAADYFTVQGLEKESQLSVYDITGKEVVRKTVVPNEKISVSTLPKGNYLVKVNDVTAKLVVK